MSAEWVLTEASEGLLSETHGTSMALHVFPARLAAIERAAVARAGIDLETARMVIAEFERVLTVDNVARALNEHQHPRPAQDGYQRLIVRSDHLGPWLTDDCAKALIAALTEDVP